MGMHHVSYVYYCIWTPHFCETKCLSFIASCDRTYCERKTYLAYDSRVEHPFPWYLKVLISSACTVPYSLSVMNTLFNSTTRESTIR
uniref:Uncharacterized protein n=1 Tax=Zea mays TaxID=4577 RepID=C0PJL1_MAIZE|nr:unknown [Zea mays]